ncbi:hypothetical protein HUJ05_006149 [Dendroctonus ponderosae]|nr:hypothetical protein HUJ05_006149 [Dendroctonus ponderosae]
MPQPVLTERPVILSKHKRNVIIHGRPLGPMGSLRSSSPYVPQQTIKSKNRALDSFGCERHAGTPSITTSLDDYQKCAQDNLITINNNLSNMLQETFSGIDCICQKVRLCLLEAKTINKIPPSGDLMKTLNVAEKEPDCEVQSIDINQDMTVADLIDETPSAKELTAETLSTQTGPTPFFTILNPKTESVESVRVELIESLTSKLGLARKCTADSFQKTMKKVDKIANYNNFLSSMVDDINKEINQSYSNYKQVEDPDSHDMHKPRTPKSSLLRRTSSKSRGELEEPPTNTVKEIQRVQTHFQTEDQFSDEWSKEDGFPRSSRNALRFYKLGIADSVKMNFTYADVYRKRAITDLHKRMLAQLEANDSLIFFQKMMKKNRKHLERNRASTTGGAPMMENGKRQKTGANHKYSLTDLGKLYQDSLWFKQRKCNTKRIKDQKKGDKKTTKRERLLPKTYSVRSASHLTGPKEALQSGGNHVPSGSTCKCKISVTNNQPLSKSDKCKIHWMRAKYSQLSHRRLKYLDILDDITKEDLMPLNPEYPRRDHMCKTIDVKDMYLYKLIHGKGQKNQQIWADLLKPTSGNSKANMMEGCHETSNMLKEQLNSDDTCQIARKLSKYIFANPETRLPHSKVFTVMPVHVFYNSRVGVSSKQPDQQQQQKLTLIPMKESKEARKSEWAKEGKKLKSEMKEQTQTEIAIYDMDPTAMDLLLDYAYTGQLTITADNVNVLLPASSMLQLQEVREACWRFLLKQLHPTNCLGIRSFADTHSCKELHLKSHAYALQNFQQVVNTEEFLLLPFEQVQELISNSQLNISSEEDVFTGVLNWVKHNLLEREKYISQLMVHVRLPLVNREFLINKVDNERLLKDHSECRELLIEAMRYHLSPEQRCCLSNTRTTDRKPKGANPYIYAIGGSSLFAIHTECEVYNPKTDLWHNIAPMQWRRSRTGVVGLRRLLYVVGGYDGATDLASAECYNPLTNTWSNVTPMGTKRSSLGVCTFDGLIYVCGGYDGASCLTSVERLDPLTGIWSSCPAMNTRRRYCRSAVVENAIYAVGGFDSTTYQASVEKFDPREGKWQSIPSMSMRRSSCGVGALDGYLYCIGGGDGTVCMSSGERLDIRRMAWEPISNMNSRRATHDVVSIRDYLFAVGGTDGSSSVTTMEAYEAKSNKWISVKSMSYRRGSIGAAVLDCINLEQVLKQTRILS